MRLAATLRTLAAALLLIALPAAAGDIRLPDYQRHVLPNGAVLLLMPKHDVPMLALDITLRGGALADPAGKEGTAQLLAELLRKGAGERDAQAFANAVDAAGGALNIGAGLQTITLNAEFLAEDAGLMLALASDALRRPTLAADEFAKVRKRAVQRLQAAKDSGPDALLSQYGEAWLFGAHPYGRPTGGSEDSLQAIDHADLLAYRQAHFGGDRLIVAVVGDFDAATMREQVTAAFGDWAPASGQLPDVAAPQRASGRRVLLVDKPGATQTYFWLGNVGAAIDDPARNAQDLVLTVFGGRFTSMLNDALRVKSGLTYGAGASIDRYRHAGAASIGSFTKTESTVQAIDLALATLDRLHSEGIDQAALDSGRNYELGQFPPTLETHGALASQLGTLEFYRLGRDEIDAYAARLRAVDLAAARAASGVFAGSGDLAIALIGDASKIREAVAKYGPVTEMPLTAGRFAPAAN